MKLLTITVPCYNSAEYMRRCIDSLLSGGERVEIIIINDGSTDNTGAIADTYRDKYPDIIKVIHQENGGHGEGINQGLKNAIGKYFKVVDSDDRLCADFPKFLDELEQCDNRGGADLIVTNYYYEHADGKGNRSIQYSNALPAGRIISWKDTRRFHIHQLLTIHSCTFRTELMKEKAGELPKHIFYEDNLMVYQMLPYVDRLYYMDVNLYRYFIGREGQSVQRDVMTRRYMHQITVTQSCFTVCRLNEIKEPRLQQYLHHELFMMFSISILYAKLNATDEAENNLRMFLDSCYSFDPFEAERLEKHSVLRLLLIPGRTGQRFVRAIYGLANKIVRFN